MRISDYKLLVQIESDLGLDSPIVRGQRIQIRRCWHFFTDGNAVNELFSGEDDYLYAMNRIYVVLQSYEVVILAFALMDTHVHFILYGEYDQCKRFVHEYIRQTSWYISFRRQEEHKMKAVSISHQAITDDYYLKTAICYTIKNPPVAGIRYNSYDYPWSSGALYFRKGGSWCSPAWMASDAHCTLTTHLGKRQVLALLNTKKVLKLPARIIGRLVFPGDYVAYEIVARLFKTHKSFNYFMCTCREDDIESRGGSISHLTIPMQEMRQHTHETCQELFGQKSIRGLSTQERLRLARTLRARYNSSLKQIARLSGLVYEEVKGIL